MSSSSTPSSLKHRRRKNPSFFSSSTPRFIHIYKQINIIFPQITLSLLTQPSQIPPNKSSHIPLFSSDSKQGNHQIQPLMEWEQRSLINELTQGKALAEQLRKHLNPSSSSPEIRRFLADKILCSYQKALSLLNLDALMAATNPQLVKNCTVVNSCPRSPVDQCRGKKRKMEPRWTEKVKACLESDMAEGVLDDGYSWRKYGQKEILGAVFPRGYYRCRHRNSQGCLATKQVQKSDNDSTVFHVTYRGRHSCGFQSDGGDSSPGKKSRTSTETVVSDMVGNGFDNLPSFVPSPGATVVPFGFDGDGNVHDMLSSAVSGTTNVKNDFVVVDGSMEASSTANSPMSNFDVDFFLDLEGDLFTMV